MPARVPPADFETEVKALRAAHTAQREALAALTAADLEMQAGNQMPMPEFLAMMIRHDSWHAAQAAVARRLWRTRESA